MAVLKNTVNIGDAQVTGDLTVNSIIKRGGTSQQILLADGSTKDMGSGTTTYLRNDGSWATPSDEKVLVSASTATAYLSGALSTSTTSQQYVNVNVYMNNGELYAYKMHAPQGFFQDSDKNKKNIISDISLEKAYDLIDKCQTIIYTLKTDETNKEQIGMIAQEVQEFFPEIISEDENGMLSLDYSRLTVVILKVLKDLIIKINNIENKVF